jgi:hypothetical protein
VYNPRRVKTICIAASSVMDNPTLLLLFLVSDTQDFYLPLEMTSCLGQLRCEGREPSHRLGGFGRWVLDREFGMPKGPEFEVGRSYILKYRLWRMHRKPQLDHLNFCYTLSIVHFKPFIWMVT